MRTLTLGLALGSGGTKGAAHVGVMKALEAAGLKVDVVAGTSIGALYGGAYATGRSPLEMDEAIRSCPIIDLMSFFRHRLKLRHDNRLARRFFEALGGHQIENLPMKFAATASDLVERREVAITSGPLIDAIEASIAIPMIARPVSHQGRFLLDGGVWEPAPVDAAAALGADVIVAVHLGQPYLLPLRAHRPALWLAGRLERVPLHRTAAGFVFSLHATARERRPGRSAGVIIRPSLRQYAGRSAFHMDKCIDAGEAAAREALPVIRALLAGEPVPVEAEVPEPAAELEAAPGGLQPELGGS